MATARELCEAQIQVFRDAGLDAKECSFGRANKLNPDVVFTGCPACSRKAREDVTVEQQRLDAAAFLKGMRVSVPSLGTGQ